MGEQVGGERLLDVCREHEHSHQRRHPLAHLVQQNRVGLELILCRRTPGRPARSAERLAVNRQTTATRAARSPDCGDRP